LERLFGERFGEAFGDSESVCESVNTILLRSDSLEERLEGTKRL